MKHDREHGTFSTTRWTLVLRAGGAEGPSSETAWQNLCKIYWYPLYAYARRNGATKEDSEDIVQGFLLSLFERQDLNRVSPEKGRFRSFLLASLKHYISHAADRARTLKRGGSLPTLSLDWEEAGARFEISDTSSGTPDEIYDREWALALLQNVLERLRAEWQAKHKEALFDLLQIFLTVDRDDAKYAETAASHGFSENYLRVNTHRLRKRYRELLREEIGQTLKNRDMIEDEMQALFKAFS